MRRMFIPLLVVLVSCTSVPMEYERATTVPGSSGELGIAAQSTGWFFSAPDAAAAGLILNGRFDGRLGYSPNGWLSFGVQSGVVRGYSTGTGWKGDYYLVDVYPYLKVAPSLGSMRLAAKVSVGYYFTFKQNGNASIKDKFLNTYADFLIGLGRKEHSTFVVRIGGTPFLGIGLGYILHVGGLSIAGMVSGFPYIMSGHAGLNLGVAYGTY